jgi:hypothetical protein
VKGSFCGVSVVAEEKIVAIAIFSRARIAHELAIVAERQPTSLTPCINRGSTAPESDCLIFVLGRWNSHSRVMAVLQQCPTTSLVHEFYRQLLSPFTRGSNQKGKLVGIVLLCESCIVLCHCSIILLDYLEPDARQGNRQEEHRQRCLSTDPPVFIYVWRIP